MVPINVSIYHDPVHDRPWQVVALRSLDALESGLSGPTPEYVLAIAADVLETKDQQVKAACAALLRSGVGYVCCWGPGCERLHDAFDKASYEQGERAGGVVMTTSHAEESLEEVLWFATHAAIPHSAYEAAFGSVVVVTIGDDDWYQRACKYLADGAPLLDEA